jgi:pterin-4a-carbinolamine dehydratase
VTEAELADLRRQIREWQLVERDGIAQLERTFHVPTFANALTFASHFWEPPSTYGVFGVSRRSGMVGRSGT